VKKFLDALVVLAAGAAVMAWLGSVAPGRARRIAPSARQPGSPTAGLLPRDAETAAGSSEADERLRERLRARLARMAHGPRAVDVEVRHGEVRLRGRVPAQDVDRLTSVVWSTPGVESIENRLAVER
jgi:hypothetical protein